MKGNEEDLAIYAVSKRYGFEPKKGMDILTEGRSRIAEFLDRDYLEKCREEKSRLEDKGYRFITFKDDCYPALLKECEDPPVGLWLKSADPPDKIFNNRPCIAVVGTRDISNYGREWCAKIVEAMAKAPVKPLIVSGLAFGVDIISQVTAMSEGLPTLSVMATGIDEIYPSRHADIAERIASTPGSGLITDYPPGTSPVATTFLRRNRIIAGMCKATILVESKIKGGGRMTARLAFSYERDVYALPGRIDDIRSQGCNAIIKEKMAEPITDLQRLVDDLGLGKIDRLRYQTPEETIRKSFCDASSERIGELLAIYKEILKNRGISIDGICQEMDMSYQDVSSAVRELECEGLVSMDILQNCSAVRMRK